MYAAAFHAQYLRGWSLNNTFVALSLESHSNRLHLEASRVIWAYRPLWSIVLHLAGPIILFEPGTACSL